MENTRLKKWLKVILPIGVIVVVGIGGMTAIQATAQEETGKEEVETRPTVKVETLSSQDYEVVIHTFGEVTAFEETQLAAQVSGEVVQWNPNFVAGGLVKRGDILFSIEKDSYEAALLQAEASLSLAKSQLIEEKARADVAKREARNLPKSKVTDLYLRKPQVLSAQAAVKSAEAQLKIAQRDLNNCEVVAPYDALVISRQLGVGQFVSKGSSIAMLSNIEVAEVTVPIAGFDSAFLPSSIHGQKAKIMSKGNVEVTYDGQISRDLGVVDKYTRMSQLVIQVEDPYGLKSAKPALKFGSYVEVSFNGKTLDNVFRLSQELVTNNTVWLVEDNKLIPQRVEVLREEGEYFIISEGLDNQQQLVTTIPEYPQRGQEVIIADSTEALVAQND